MKRISWAGRWEVRDKGETLAIGVKDDDGAFQVLQWPVHLAVEAMLGVQEKMAEAGRKRIQAREQEHGIKAEE